MTWDYIEEYEMYNITIRDTLKYTMSRDSKTSEDIVEPQVIEQPTDKDYIPRSFDVSKNGEYLGIPRIQEFMAQTYKALGIDIEK